ncbi:MAG: ATP-binding protein, partial [Candidatus Omnitrophica bacterium]|nr:ATP-binding protein [Candidatus Omnitrophota bacterium]
GFPVWGTGYIVDYEEKPNGDGQIKPKKQSFMKQLAAACQDYHNGKAYAAVAFDSLRMGLTQGDIRNQAKGLISLWADQLIKKKAVVNSGAYPAFSRLPVKKPTVHLEKSRTSAGFLITSIEKTIIITEPAGVRRLLYRDSAFGLGEQNAVISKVEDMLKSILIHAPGRKKVKVVVSGQWQTEVFSFKEDENSITFNIHWVLLQEGIGSPLLEDVERHEIEELLTGSHDEAVQRSYDYFRKNPEELENFFEALDKSGVQLDASYQNSLSVLLFELMGRKISNVIGRRDSRISRPINLLFIGDPGVLKSTTIKSLSKVLSESGLRVADAVNPEMRNDLDEAYRGIGGDNSFEALNKKYSGFDVVIAEVVSKPPTDGQNIDLLVRLRGSLSSRQQRIAEGSGSYDYAQLRTEVSAVSLDSRQPDIILNTDFIDRDKLDINWIEDTFRKTVKINLSSMAGTINVNSFMDGIISNHNDPEGDVALRGIRINTYYGQDVFLNGIDEVALTYIFEEIFSNALRFSPTQGTVTIETSTVELTGENICVVKIIDEGAGIASEDIARLCQNEETTRPDEDEGGRGLFIAETFINKYRGKLVINSDLGKGTSVTVMLPAALEANHGAAEADLSASGSKFLARDTVDRIIEKATHRKDNLGHLCLDVSADDKFLKRFFKESPHAYMYERISRYLEKMRVEIHILKGLPHKGYWQVDLSDENEPMLKIFVNNGEKEDFGLIAIHETAAAVTAVFAEPMTGKIIPTSHKTNCEIEADYVVWQSRCKNSIVFRYMSGMGFDYRFSTRAKNQILGIAGGNIDFSAGTEPIRSFDNGLRKKPFSIYGNKAILNNNAGFFGNGTDQMLEALLQAIAEKRAIVMAIERFNQLGVEVRGRRVVCFEILFGARSDYIFSKDIEKTNRFCVYFSQHAVETINQLARKTVYSTINGGFTEEDILSIILQAVVLHGLAKADGLSHQEAVKVQGIVSGYELVKEELETAQMVEGVVSVISRNDHAGSVIAKKYKLALAGDFGTDSRDYEINFRRGVERLLKGNFLEIGARDTCFLEALMEVLPVLQRRFIHAISPSFREEKSYLYERSNGRFIKGKIENVPQEWRQRKDEDKFRKIFAFDVFAGCYMNLETVLSNICDILQDGGELIIHYSDYTDNEAIEFLRNSGLFVELRG